MTYVKVDDHFPEHPKVLAVGPIAEALWLRALCYSGRNQTDGFVPAAFVFRMNDMDGEAESAALCDAGLWAATDAGWTIHDYPDWQRSKEDIQELSQKRSEAGRKGVEAKRKQVANELLAHPQANAKQTASKPDPYTDTDTDTDTDTEKREDGADAPTPTPARPPHYSQEFEETFWRHYPSGHGSKKAAYDRWRRLAPDDRAAAAAALQVWTASDHWQDGYIKNAESFLAQRMWENDPPAPKRSRAPNDPVGRTGTGVVHLAPALAARMAERKDAKA